MTRVISMLAVLAAFGPLATLDAQSSVSLSTEVAYRTKYLFAGIPFAAANVTQGGVTAATGGLTLNVLSVLDHDASDITEGDVYGDYYAQVDDRIGVFVGAGLYTFKIEGAWDPTFELYGGVVLAAPLSPTLYVAHDFDLGAGTHATLTLSQGVPLGGNGLTLLAATNLEYNSGYYREGSGMAFADLVLSVGLPVGPVTVTPMVQIQRAIADDFTDEELFGLTASFAP